MDIKLDLTILAEAIDANDLVALAEELANRMTSDERVGFLTNCLKAATFGCIARILGEVLGKEGAEATLRLLKH